MTQQTINLGPSDNPSSGDSLRIALGKCNSNFTDLYGTFASFTANLTVSSLGAVASDLLGVANGVATLGSDGKLLSSQIPAGGTSGLNFGEPVEVSGLTNNQIIVYNDTSAEWVNISRPYTPSGFFSGSPTNGQNVHAFIAPANAVFAANMAGSIARCLTAPVSGATFAIYQNTTILGIISFSASSTSGSFSMIGSYGIDPIVVSANDVFYISCSSADASLADFVYFFAGTLT